MFLQLEHYVSAGELTELDHVDIVQTTVCIFNQNSAQALKQLTQGGLK